MSLWLLWRTLQLLLWTPSSLDNNFSRSKIGNYSLEVYSQRPNNSKLLKQWFLLNPLTPILSKPWNFIPPRCRAPIYQSNWNYQHESNGIYQHDSKSELVVLPQWNILLTLNQPQSTTPRSCRPSYRPSQASSPSSPPSSSLQSATKQAQMQTNDPTVTVEDEREGGVRTSAALGCAALAGRHGARIRFSVAQRGSGRMRWRRERASEAGVPLGFCGGGGRKGTGVE